MPTRRDFFIEIGLALGAAEFVAACAPQPPRPIYTKPNEYIPDFSLTDLDDPEFQQRFIQKFYQNPRPKEPQGVFLGVPNNPETASGIFPVNFKTLPLNRTHESPEIGVRVMLSFRKATDNQSNIEAAYGIGPIGIKDPTQLSDLLTFSIDANKNYLFISQWRRWQIQGARLLEGLNLP